ncbi:MAG TPA: glycosyltransferase [Opitutaceae bacterium]|nr:glycosyltransferase [Opitutaceae bacterium]
MKILVLSNLYPPDVIGGYELACAHAVDGLRSRGHEVRVLTSTPRRPVPPAPHVARNLALADVYDHEWMARSSSVVLWLKHAEAHLVNAHNVHVLIAAIEEFRPDVVYVCNLIGLGGLTLMACLQYLKVPWIWQLGDCLPKALCHLPQGVVPALAREFGRALVGTYIVVSRRLLQEIEDAGITLPGRVEVLPNWVRGDRPAARARYYRGGHLRVASAGQLGYHKGVHLIIEAAALLCDEGHDDVAFEIYGDGDVQAFQTLIRKLGVADRVRLMGPRTQEEIAALFGNYDVFLFPTWSREPFGMAPLEAAAAGCVPVISESCGIGEWLVHGVHCLKAERTAAAFAGVLREIIEGRIDLEPLGRRGAAAAWRDFHLDVYLDKLERLMDRAARQARSGAGSPDEAYRLALLAEKLTKVLIQEAAPR